MPLDHLHSSVHMLVILQKAINSSCLKQIHIVTFNKSYIKKIVSDLNLAWLQYVLVYQIWFDI